MVGHETPWGVGTAFATDILSGRSVYVNDEKIVGTMPNIASTNITPGTEAKTIAQGYHDGTGTVSGDAALTFNNIHSGVTVFGMPGKPEVVDTTSGDATAEDIVVGE